MATLSIPVTDEQEAFIERMVKSGKAANKAHVVRYAIQRLSEDEAIAAVLEGEADIRAGRVYRGDLRTLVKKVRI